LGAAPKQGCSELKTAILAKMATKVVARKTLKLALIHTGVFDMLLINILVQYRLTQNAEKPTHRETENDENSFISNAK